MISRRFLSRGRTHGTAETFPTRIWNVGLLAGATVGAVRTTRLIMASVHGPPATGLAAVGFARAADDFAADAAAAAAVASGGVGVATLLSDGTTWARAGVGTGEPEAADAVPPPS